MDSCFLTTPELATKLESVESDTSSCGCSDQDDCIEGNDTVTEEDRSDECCTCKRILNSFKRSWVLWKMMKCNHVYMVLTLFILISVYVPLTASLQINVSLGFLTPLDESLGPLSVLGKELESAFKLAVKAVNRGDNKVYIREDFAAAVRDEGIQPSKTCASAAEFFHKGNEYVGIVGGYYSQCSISVQKKIQEIRSNIPQLSYRSPSILLTKREYSGFYRMASNNKEQAQVVLDLIKHYRWSQVGIVHTTDLYYGKELSDEIVSKLTRQLINIRVTERVSFKPGSSDMKIDEQLYVIENAGSRINVIVAQGEDVVRILKRLKAKKMYGKGWVWILTDGGTCLDLSNDRDANVTANGMVGIAPEMFKGKAYVDNVIVQWFQVSEEEYPGKFWKKKGSMPNVSPYVGQVYLAVSTYHNILTELANEGNLTQETDIAEVRRMLRKKLDAMVNVQTSRKSIFANKVYFNDGTDGPPSFTITNYVGELFKQVGKWDGTEEEDKRLKMDLKSTIIWPGGSLKPPKIKGKPGKLSFRVGFVGPTNPLLGALGEIGKELLSAFKVAVDMINEEENYQIEIEPVIKDEGFDGSDSCYKIAEEMKKQKIIAVVGAYRSECSMKLHQVLGSESMKIPIVSYASLSRKLSNKDMYKYFFRVVPPNVAEAEIMKQLIHKYRFKEVSILYSDEISSKEIALQFAACMKNLSVAVTLSEEFAQNANAETLRKHLHQIRQSGSRVIFISALPNDARMITQLIKELEMAGRGWIWFGSTGVATQHFRHTSNVGNVLNGMIGINPKDGDGLLYTQFRVAWKAKDALQYPGIIHSSNADKSRPYTPQVYDAVNAIGLALSDLVQRKGITFKTSRQQTRRLLYEKLKAFNAENGYLSATGESSKMYFDKNQDAPLAFDVVNLLDNSWKTIGRYPVKSDAIMFLEDPLFPGEVTKPVVNPGKIIYKVAAFFPTHFGLNALAELGTKWKRALTAAVNWLKRNDSLTVGFDVLPYDTGLYSSNCSKLAENLPLVDFVIGAARSECTKNLYRVLERRGIPIITYSSTSSVLSHKSDYPNLFRVCSSDEHQARALADLIEKYSWDRIGIVGSKGIYGQELANSLSNMLSDGAIKVTSNQNFEAGDVDMERQVKTLSEAGSGVNLIIANPNDAMQLFQEAFEINMVGKGWTWIGSDGATSTSFKRKQNLLAAMQGMIGIRAKVGSGPMFHSIFRELSRIDPDADIKTAYLAQVFDTILLPAFALHELHLKREAESSVLGKVSPQDLLEYLRHMNSPENGFKSATGQTLYFDSNQDVIPLYDLVNLNGDWIIVGSYNDGQLDITRGVVWPGGTIKVPPSHPPRYDVSPHVADEGGTSIGLVVLAVVFGGFSLLVIVFMVYIVRRVRHRHLYMQSDINHGGVFSVLYGHTVNRPGLPLQTTLPLQTNTQLKLDSIDSGNGTEILDPMIPRNV